VRRLGVLQVIALAAFVILVGRLWYLQVLEGPRLDELSESNRIRVRSIVAPRGMLYDRHGVLLVDSRPTFRLAVVPRELVDRQSEMARLSILLQIPVSELEGPLRDAPVDSPWPVGIRAGLTFDDVTRVEEWRAELPGVVVEVEPRRDYPSGPLAPHVIGYVREAGAGKRREPRDRRGDRAGQSGLERLLDDVLRGRDGGEAVEVDSSGRAMRTLWRTEPRPGADVVTSLDRRIQAAAERALGEAPGAVVVMDPRDGDVLAMVSSPSFDLGRFAGPLQRDEWLDLVRHPHHPLLNRAFQGQYPPGSIFKLVVAAAALEEGVITPSATLSCPGEIRIGNRGFRNWRHEDQGPMTLERAVATSCNTFFYQLGLEVGAERIARYARAFGFGEAAGIELGGEGAGLVPTPRGPDHAIARSSLSGDTANLAIGQGGLLVTPLQVARFFSALANGGMLWRPRLIHRIGGDEGAPVLVGPEAAGRVELSGAVFAVLRHSLWSAVNQGGTASAAAVPGLDVAGKTGTAQIVRDSDPARGQEHAWFAGYAPAGDPRVVVVVLVERGGSGGHVAAPIAREIFLEILRDVSAAAGRS
jgi:penicillin-binding protein 2